jgi:flavin-binding protein dodecin
MAKYLAIISYETKEVVKKIDITGRSENSIDRIERGMLINMNKDDYYITEIEE